jgi:DNA sulfur modification protein DndB
MDNDGLIKVSELSSRKINKISKPFLFKTVKKNKVTQYLDDGWEIVKSKLKKSVKLRKPKGHWKAFEHRIWALMAKMEFEKISKLDDFKIEYAKGLTKQIDVLAVDEEAILVIECKSTKERKRKSYQKDINEFIGIKDNIRKYVKKLTAKKPKVAFIFATENAIISKNDRARIKEAAENDNFFHFNQDMIEYYEQLTNLLGSAAKYQLFGHLFQGQKIPGLEIKVPAIKGKLKNGCSFYSFCIDPYKLLKLSYILHRSDASPELTNSYQRLVKKSRLKKIGKFINNGGYFPNSIIVNLDVNKVKFDRGTNTDIQCNSSYGILTLPKLYKSIFIIDGQHRLYGYSKSKTESNHTVIVVAFQNLEIEEQTNIFVDINHTQKSVPANLLQSIMADFNWNSSNDKKALSALKTRIFVKLNSQDDSPFYKRIIVAQEHKTTLRCLTLKSLKDWGLNRTQLFGKLKGSNLIKTGYLSDINHEKTLEKSISFFKTCFNYISEKLPEHWERGSAPGGFISMNIGVSAFIRLFEDLIYYKIKIKKIKPEDLTGEELAYEILDLLDPVFDFIIELDNDGIKKMRSKFGSGATQKVVREFQYAINKTIRDFNPEGLEQWIKERSGKFTKLAYELGNSKLQPQIDKFIKKKLIAEFGNDKYWFSGVPEKVRTACAMRRQQEKSNKEEWMFLDTIHYKDIIDKNWSLLGDFFTPPGFENKSKKKKLQWLVDFNSLRKRYSHPQREKITESEYNELKKTYDWLADKLSST